MDWLKVARNSAAVGFRHHLRLNNQRFPGKLPQDWTQLHLRGAMPRAVSMW